jgi:hypothetical protein
LTLADSRMIVTAAQPRTANTLLHMVPLVVAV